MGNYPGLENKQLIESVQKSLNGYLDAIVENIESKVQSVTLTGSVVTEDYKPGKSDINSIITLKSNDFKTLEKISKISKSFKKTGIAQPLIMTEKYIKRSLDVFGIEFLDFGLRHITLLGDDPFENLDIKKSDVRLQCERELKATLIRLRQSYISSSQDVKSLCSVITAAGSGVLPVLRAMLWLKDEERPTSIGATISEAGKKLSIQPHTFEQATLMKYDGTKLKIDKASELFENLYWSIERLSETIDGMEV